MSADINDTHVYTTTELTGIGECVRKWACKRLHRLPDPKHPAAAAGIELHQILEQMLRHGPAANVNPESEVGKWARALYPLAPAGCHAELEQPFELNLPAEHRCPACRDSLPCLFPLNCNVRFRSSFKIDFVFPDFTGFGDWKSCAGAKWAVHDLANDLQANLETYGFAKVMGFPPNRAVNLLWLYVDKRSPGPTPKAWPVRGAISFAEAEAWLVQNALPRLRLIRAMRALRPPPPPSAIPHDITACGGTGRNCNYLGHCTFRPSTVGLTTETLYQLVK